MTVIKQVGRHLFTLSVLLLFASFVTVCAVEANAATRPTFRVEATAPDASGCFEVSVSAENMEFLASELAFRYDTSVLAPIDPETGEPTESFSVFASSFSYDGLARIGEKLDIDKGYFLFTMFASPGVESSYVWDKMLHFEAKTELYRFAFKVIGEGDMSLYVASAYDGGVYDPFFPDGAVITSTVEKRPVADVLFITDGTVRTEQTVTYYYSELYLKNYTKEQRLAGTVYLVENDYAAAVDGALCAVDTLDRRVVPYRVNDTLLVPLRFVCESLGCTVDWNEETGTVTVTRPDGSVGTLNTSTGEAFADGEALDGVFEVTYDRTVTDTALACALAGARVYDAGSGIVLYTGLPEWTPEREAEKQALEAMQYVLMPFFRMFL